ncbi:MAG: glycosyltransferase family 2 protein [Acidobacteria bacterium]|nr:glycosyltransferase family 2 protein [Acidobacteriota bacterium]
MDLLKVSEPLKIALVIPVFNRRETTLQALRSLSRIDTSGMEIRIHIVDDGSTDGTSEAITKEFPDVVIVPGTGSLHYAGGTNAGIEAASVWNPNHYLLMNDDSVFHDQFLQRLAATANAYPRSVVGALLLLWDEPHKVFQVAPEWKTFRGGWQIPEDLTAFNVPDQAFEVEGLVGNCTLVPAAAVMECGLMDAERFAYGWGDAQYFRKLSNAGWELLVEPKSYVWCEPNTYPPPLHSQGLRHVLRVLFIDKRHPTNLQRQFAARWHSAPNKITATLSFAIFLFQLAGKAIKFGNSSRTGQS